MSLILHDPQIQKYIVRMVKKARLDDFESKFDNFGRPFERKYKVKMREIFDQQLDEIMTNLQEFKSYTDVEYKIKADKPKVMTFNYEAISHPPLHPHCRCCLIPIVDLKSFIRRITKAYANPYKAITKAIDDYLIDWSAYQIMYNEFGQLMLPNVMEWGQEASDFFEVGVSFDVLDPNVQTAIINRANRFSDDVVNTTRDMLHQVINEAIQVGDGIPQIEKKIRALYSDMSKYRSVRIARTETIWAQNEGAEQSYIQSGVVDAKEWLTAKDDRRCVWCASMEGKRIGLGEHYFNLGDSLTIEG